jgi:hypothetical protein
VPRSRNTRIRPKDTSRAEARRRHRDEQRAVDPDQEAELAASPSETAAQPAKPMFAMPDVAADVRALPQVFRKKLVWLPFGLLAITFLLSVALINGLFEGLPEPVTSAISLYISLTLHPTSLFIFFIGGFVAPRASYSVGGILGVLSAVIYLAVISIASERARVEHADTLLSTSGEVASVTPELAVQTLGMGLVIGIFAGGFAAWYRRFLRSSQERAAANRAQRDREQAAKAKEQARVDREAVRTQKYADREARRKTSS